MTEYIIGIVAVIIAIILIKRFVGCLVRILVTLALLAVLLYLYYNYMQGGLACL
ncbi:MAG: hypothetical protein Q4E63_00065 [Prevotellaceae bacterium]|nr:hypothetical protein [Prevotellaceae bacterium]MDO4931036.1 hypothetical protein [Prevotellaceae bacterium]